MKRQDPILTRLALVSDRIGSLPESREGIIALKEAIQEAHSLAQLLLSESVDPADYFGKLLVNRLLNDVNDLAVYGHYALEQRNTLLFHRCQRYALSDIGRLVGYLEGMGARSAGR